MGRHARTGEVLLSARGAAGRTSGVSSEARPVARHGDPGELLSLAEAAFLIGVEPTYLRKLAKNRPQTFFATPTGVEGLDPRLARRMIEWLCRQPLTPPAKAYLPADKDPDSGQWQVTRGEVERFIADRVVPETVMGYDLVCSAPKSVSLLWAVGDDKIRSDIAKAFDAAVNATVAYLEQHACQAMVAGRNRPADGFGVVSFVHDTSRANEAHLHTHNLIVNAVRVPLLDDAGRPQVDEHGAPEVVWRAPDGDILMRHVKTAGYLGAAELRHQLATRWGVEWGPVRSGVAELAAFPEALLHAFSTRHDQVSEEFAQMVESGFEPGAVTEAAAQRASRAPKMVLADGKVRAIQLAKLAEIGWTAQGVRGLVSVGRAVSPPVIDAEKDVAPAPPTARRANRIDRTPEHVHRPRRPPGGGLMGGRAVVGRRSPGAGRGVPGRPGGGSVRSRRPPPGPAKPRTGVHDRSNARRRGQPVHPVPRGAHRPRGSVSGRRSRRPGLGGDRLHVGPDGHRD